MKLAAVWLATQQRQQDALSAWVALTSLKISPSVAYELLSFGETLADELDVINKQKNKLLYEITNTEPGGSVSLGSGTPLFNEFARQFNEFLVVDSRLAPCKLSFEKLLVELEKVGTNTISSIDLALLKPLFVTEKKE